MTSLVPKIVLALSFACLALGVLGCGGQEGSTIDASTPDSRGGGGQCNFCVADEGCCGGFCVDNKTSETHCGECNISCGPPASDTCTTGVCTCNGGASCTGSSICCSSGCQDIQSDPTNCGLCGKTCGADEACLGGQCVCAVDQVQCAGSDTCCADGCTDVQTDPAHCGACETACEPSATCAAGLCECALACPDTVLPGCCLDGCMDLCTDPANCGVCGLVCPNGESCTNGICASNGGFPNLACLLGGI